METLKRQLSKMNKEERLLILENLKKNPLPKIKDHKITKKTTILSFD